MIVRLPPVARALVIDPPVPIVKDVSVTPADELKVLTVLLMVRDVVILPLRFRVVTMPLTVTAVAPAISIVVAPFTEFSVLPVATIFVEETADTFKAVARSVSISTLPAVMVQELSIAAEVSSSVFVECPFTLEIGVVIVPRAIVLFAATALWSIPAIVRLPAVASAFVMEPAVPRVNVVIAAPAPPAASVVTAPFMVSEPTVLAAAIVSVVTVVAAVTVSAVTSPVTSAASAPAISIVVAPLTEARFFPVAVTLAVSVAVTLIATESNPETSTLPEVIVHEVRVPTELSVNLLVAWPFTLDMVTAFILFRLIVLSAATAL